MSDLKYRDTQLQVWGDSVCVKPWDAVDGLISGEILIWKMVRTTWRGRWELRVGNSYGHTGNIRRTVRFMAPFFFCSVSAWLSPCLKKSTPTTNAACLCVALPEIQILCLKDQISDYLHVKKWWYLGWEISAVYLYLWSKWYVYEFPAVHEFRADQGRWNDPLTASC